jgi:hypothetical protein
MNLFILHKTNQMKNKTNIRFGALTAIVGLATLVRIATPPLLGHPSNFAPIGALALFSGCYFSGRFSKFLIPLLALWVGDLFLDRMYTGKWMMFYEGFYWQYACYIVFVLMGIILSKQVKPIRVLGASLTATFLFFIVSNFGVWAGGLIYPHTAGGLLACYVAGIPFIGGTLAGDLFYSALMFGVFELAQRKYAILHLPARALRIDSRPE